MRGAAGAAGTGVSMVAGEATFVESWPEAGGLAKGAGLGLFLSRKLDTISRQYSSALDSLCDDDSSELLGGLLAKGLAAGSGPAPAPASDAAPAAARGTLPPLRELDPLALARHAPAATLNALMEACWARYSALRA